MTIRRLSAYLLVLTLALVTTTSSVIARSPSGYRSPCSGPGCSQIEVGKLPTWQQEQIAASAKSEAIDAGIPAQDPAGWQWVDYETQPVHLVNVGVVVTATFAVSVVNVDGPNRYLFIIQESGVGPEFKSRVHSLVEKSPPSDLFGVITLKGESAELKCPLALQSNFVACLDLLPESAAPQSELRVGFDLAARTFLRARPAGPYQGLDVAVVIDSFDTALPIDRTWETTRTECVYRSSGPVDEDVCAAFRLRAELRTALIAVYDECGDFNRATYMSSGLRFVTTYSDEMATNILAMHGVPVPQGTGSVIGFGEVFNGELMTVSDNCSMDPYLIGPCLLRAGSLPPTTSWQFQAEIKTEAGQIQPMAIAESWISIYHENQDGIWVAIASYPAGVVQTARSPIVVTREIPTATATPTRTLVPAVTISYVYLPCVLNVRRDGATPVPTGLSTNLPRNTPRPTWGGPSPGPTGEPTHPPPTSRPLESDEVADRQSGGHKVVFVPVTNWTDHGCTRNECWDPLLRSCVNWGGCY